MELNLNSEEVINGIESFHNDAYEDRVFKFKVCNIEKN